MEHPAAGCHSGKSIYSWRTLITTRLVKNGNAEDEEISARATMESWSRHSEETVVLFTGPSVELDTNWNGKIQCVWITMTIVKFEGFELPCPKRKRAAD